MTPVEKAGDALRWIAAQACRHDECCGQLGACITEKCETCYARAALSLLRPDTAEPAPEGDRFGINRGMMEATRFLRWWEGGKNPLVVAARSREDLAYAAYSAGANDTPPATPATKTVAEEMEAFEACMKDLPFPVNLSYGYRSEDLRDTYFAFEVRLAWSAWQARALAGGKG